MACASSCTSAKASPAMTPAVALPPRSSTRASGSREGRTTPSGGGGRVLIGTLFEDGAIRSLRCWGGRSAADGWNGGDAERDLADAGLLQEVEDVNHAAVRHLA